MPMGPAKFPYGMGKVTRFLQGGQVVRRAPHKHQIPGSIPGPATNSVMKTFKEIDETLVEIQRELESRGLRSLRLAAAAGMVSNLRWHIQIGAEHEDETSIDLAHADESVGSR